jgi:hypothetical protein
VHLFKNILDTNMFYDINNTKKHLPCTPSAKDKERPNDLKVFRSELAK